jgi:hypothetical protein
LNLKKIPSREDFAHTIHNAIIPPMETFKNIKKVSILFFAIIGMLHIGSSLYLANNPISKEALIINKTLDIPFIITGLIYGLSSLRISLANQEKSHRMLDASLIITIIVIFAGLILVNLFVPDINNIKQ